MLYDFNPCKIIGSVRGCDCQVEGIEVFGYTHSTSQKFIVKMKGFVTFKMLSQLPVITKDDHQHINHQSLG